MGHGLAARLRIGRLRRLVDESMVVAPLLWSLVALVVGLALSYWRVPQSAFLARLVWPASRQDAVQVLTMLASAELTVVSFVVTALVVTLQLASQQFTPRLLRALIRDRTIKRVLATLLATFVYCVTLVRGMPLKGPLPHPALFIAFLLALATVLAIVWFLSHIVTELRVDTMMVAVHREGVQSLKAEFAAEGEAEGDRHLPDPAANAVPVAMPDDGFVDALDLDAIAAWATERDAFVRVDVSPGVHVVEGVPIGWAWRCDGSGSLDAGELAQLARETVAVSFERTPQQDTAYAFRRLVDIGVKAMSPAVNDPTTAGHAIGHLSSLLRVVARRRLGPAYAYDDSGTLRAAAARNDLRFFLALSCGQLRRYGAREPATLVALLVMLRDVALVCHGDRDDLAALVHEADLVVQAAEESLRVEADLEVVHRRRAAIDAVIAGDLERAYDDRTDEALSR
jgi:uncharacterized membrane protein